MIQIYADNVLVYESRLAEYALQSLTLSRGLNVGGTAVITMPPHHPAYDAFVAFRTIVEVYKDGNLRFRGRALPPADDFYNMRTVTCEGERCFFQDAVSRPYLYQDSPAMIFAELLHAYNSQVEAFKQFKLGTVTVTDPNDYIRLESEAPESILDTINKLVERCGGYIVFTTDEDGARVANWYEELGYRSGQVIDFGSNLLNFSRNSANTSLATGIYPLGAVDETTGERVTIESVNEGVDYLIDTEAQSLRGTIIKSVVWDDVTIPSNLLQKAQQWLAQNRVIVTALELSALDLSYMDKTIDSFDVGDLIRVRSKPHQVDEEFQLTTLNEDLLNPANSTIALGKERRTLTSADVAGDDKSLSEMHKIQEIVKADYTLNIAQAIEQTEQRLTSLIEQTAEAIRTEVSESAVTQDQVTELISTSMTQLSDSFTFQFTELRATVDKNDAEMREQFQLFEAYIRFEDGNIVLGEKGSELILRQKNDRISFLDGGAEVAYFSNKQLVVLDGHFLHSLRIGPVAFIPRENGNISLTKVGE